MNRMSFACADVGTLCFPAHVVQRMHAHRQVSSRSKEAGGILLGRHLLDSDDVIVDEVTEPMRTDRRTWSSFFRSVAHHATALNRWNSANGTCAYLGSWHTHPEPNPHPSGTDRSDWLHALARDRFEGSRLFFVIVGQQRLRVWQGRKDSEEIIELNQATAGVTREKN